MKKNAKIGNAITYLDCIDSTNNYVANLISEGKIEHGQVIMADFQGEGRGQRGSNWLSDKGKNLLISVFISFDNLSANKQSQIMQFAALSVSSALSNLGIQAQIKWPNDIVIEGNKICGILIENQISGQQIKNSIIGVGLNVNQEIFSNLQATSIKNQLQQEQNRIEILSKLLDSFNYFYELLIIDNQTIKSFYLDNLYKFNTISKFQNSNLGEFYATIIDVNQEGKLVVSHNDENLTFDLKEIKFID